MKKEFLNKLFLNKNGQFVALISLIYVAIPYLIFAFGWLTPPAAILISFLLVLAIILYFKNCREENPNPIINRGNLKYFLIASGIFILWALLSGMGGFGYQNNPDWEKNNAIFHDLFLFPSPVEYKDYYLVYYMAYYLPISLIMKLFGWHVGYLFGFLWGVIGLIICLWWIKRLTPNISDKLLPLVAILFVLFSGADVLGIITRLLLTGNPDLTQIIAKSIHIEWWASLFQFSSNTTTLFWVPQYAMQGWILTAMIIHNIKNLKTPSNLGFLWSLCIFGVPLMFLAIIPLIAAGIYSTRAKIKEIFSARNFIAAPFIILFLMTYFSSKAFKDPVNAFSAYMFNPTFVVMYILFVIFEFGLYVFVLYRYFKTDSVWNISVIAMFLMPLVRIGGGNDFNMRGSVCYLFVLFIFFTKALFDKEYGATKTAKVMLVILFTLGAFTPFLEIKRSAEMYSAKVPLLKEQFGVMDLYKYRSNNQYLGDRQSFFWKYLAKKSSKKSY